MGANLQFQLYYPAEVTPGFRFSISLKVTNTGNSTGSFRAQMISDFYAMQRFNAVTPLSWPNGYVNIPAGQTIFVNLLELQPDGSGMNPIMPDPAAKFTDHILGSTTIVGIDGADGNGNVIYGQMFNFAQPPAGLLPQGHPGSIYSSPFFAQTTTPIVNKKYAAPGDQIIVSTKLKNLGKDYKCWAAVNNFVVGGNVQSFDYDPAAHNFEFVQNFTFNMPQPIALSNGYIFKGVVASGHYADWSGSTLQGSTVMAATDMSPATSLFSIYYSGHFLQTVANPAAAARAGIKTQLNLGVRNDGAKTSNVEVRIYDDTLTLLGSSTISVLVNNSSGASISFTMPNKNFTGIWELHNSETGEIDHTGTWSNTILHSDIIFTAPLVASATVLKAGETATFISRITNVGKASTTYYVDLVDDKGNIYASTRGPIQIIPGVPGGIQQPGQAQLGTNDINTGQSINISLDFIMPKDTERVKLHMIAVDEIENTSVDSAEVEVRLPGVPPTPPSEMAFSPLLLIGGIAALGAIGYLASRKKK